MPRSGNYPAQTVDGAEMTVTLEGTLIGDLATVYTTYISPLLALVGTEVTLTADGVLDGTWLVDDCAPNRDNPAAWGYSLTLSKGSSNYTFG